MAPHSIDLNKPQPYKVVPTTTDAEVERFTRQLRPDVVIVSGWQVPAYRRAARALTGAVRVVCMDNQWLATGKQRLGVISSRWYLKPYFDIAFVPGDRQFQFARRLGYDADEVWWGLYSANTHIFRPPRNFPDEGGFVFVGRLVESKGVDVLLKAYMQYRAVSLHPWPLYVYGTGPLAPLVDGRPGVSAKGFVQAPQLAVELRGAQCLLAPSRFEPWGVNIHEAASSGLAVIASTACGAVSHIIRDGLNGYLVEPGSVRSLASAMLRFSSSPRHVQAQMGLRSVELAKHYSPDIWADAVEGGLRRVGRL